MASKQTRALGRTWLGISVAVSFFSCTVADENRCLKGYTWDPEIKACRDEQSSGADQDLDAAVDEDAGTGDGGPGNDVPTGMGVTCTAEGNECVGFDASFCLYDIRQPGEPGICTIKDCTAGDCPAGYQCCNLILNVVCLPDDGVAEAITSGGRCPP